MGGFFGHLVLLSLDYSNLLDQHGASKHLAHQHPNKSEIFEIPIIDGFGEISCIHNQHSKASSPFTGKNLLRSQWDHRLEGYGFWEAMGPSLMIVGTSEIHRSTLLKYFPYDTVMMHLQTNLRAVTVGPYTMTQNQRISFQKEKTSSKMKLLPDMIEAPFDTPHKESFPLMVSCGCIVYGTFLSGCSPF
jgi:hypothetical protein